MKTRRDFLKRTALFGASAFMAPSLLGREGDGDCFFSEVYGDKCFCASSDPAHYRVLFIFQHTAVVAKGGCMYSADCYVYYGC